ncbi:Anaphase-promoting complex subunit 11 [Larimichthys crocea]|uniref:Uncharacterized protein n=1 Tax=Larimichthys crocea TaxID=215358 RepID=A0ACD3RX04_LARCR|nr:Anaphase-promoting complex subunit 11 [Larimichthys crocea]
MEERESDPGHEGEVQRRIEGRLRMSGRADHCNTVLNVMGDCIGVAMVYEFELEEEVEEIETRRRMKVKIRQWSGVASWLWVANDENCGICRMPFNGCCPDCKVPGDDCPLVWGQCSHCFHMHCILKWLNSQQVQQQCPMCRQEWKFKE